MQSIGSPSERLADPPRAARTDRSERDDLVPGLGADLGEAGDHAADVVPDARSRKRERAHVDHDSHGPEQTLRLESVQPRPNSIHVVAGRRRSSRACAIVIGFDLLSAAGVVVP